MGGQVILVVVLLLLLLGEKTSGANELVEVGSDFLVNRANLGRREEQALVAGANCAPILLVPMGRRHVRPAGAAGCSGRCWRQKER